MLTVDVVVLPHGVGLGLPERATPGAAGFDLRAAIDLPLVIEPGRRLLVPTGIAMAIPAGWEGQVRPRSGLALKHGVTLINAPGTIDCDYRGELKVPLVNLGEAAYTLTRGDRIAQILFAPVPEVALRVVAALGHSGRGSGGFGSTG